MPQAFAQDTPVPVLAGRITNGDLANAVLSYRYALLSCNADKAALRQWDLNLNQSKE